MSDKNVCCLSAGDLESIIDGEVVGPWLFDGEEVYVKMDTDECEKIDGVHYDHSGRKPDDTGEAEQLLKDALEDLE